MNSAPARTFDWSRFLTGMTQTGFRFAVPQFASGNGFSQGSSGNAFAAGSGSSYASSRMGSGGMRGMGGTSMFDLGDNFLRNMAAASGGALGSSLNTLSQMMSLPRAGVELPGKSSGLDMRLSGSMGNMLGGGMGRMGGGSGALGMQGNGFSSAGDLTGASGGAHGGGGRGYGPGLSLNIKF